MFIDTDATSQWFQLRTVVNRTNLAYYRNADYQLTRLFNHISIGLLVGLTFLSLDNSIAALQYRVFCIFMVVCSMHLCHNLLHFGIDVNLNQCLPSFSKGVLPVLVSGLLVLEHQYSI